MRSDLQSPGAPDSHLPDDGISHGRLPSTPAGALVQSGRSSHPVRLVTAAIMRAIYYTGLLCLGALVAGSHAYQDKKGGVSSFPDILYAPLTTASSKELEYVMKNKLSELFAHLSA